MANLERRSVLIAGASLGLSTFTGRETPAFGSTPGQISQSSAAVLDNAALRILDKRSKETKSDAVRVYHRGQKVFEYYSGAPEPIALMSCTKSICSLAVGRALAEGKIKSIDQPIYDFFPEMQQGRKAAMTIRHLLSMTSGIQNTGTGYEVYPRPDWVRLALTAELTTAPGTSFDYNNKAVNLLSGVIHVATKEPLDDYVTEQFFIPMDIKSWSWWRDSESNASAMADLALFPADFAKFGLLMQQNGQWKGKELIPADWVKLSGIQSQPYEPLYGLLWWRTPKSSIGQLSDKRVTELAKGGLKRGFIAALRHLQGETFHTLSEWHHALESVLPSWEKEAQKYPGVIDVYASDVPLWRYSDFDGIQAEGSFGQYMAIFPRQELVAVRMIKSFDGFTYNQNRFEDFADLVRALVPNSTLA